MLKLTKSLTGEVVRWEAPRQPSVLLGFISPGRLYPRVFKTAHPALDAIDGQPWGDSIAEQATTIMKGIK